jgi:hypothetical protein
VSDIPPDTISDKGTWIREKTISAAEAEPLRKKLIKKEW